MEPTDEHLSLALTDDQVERIAMMILDEFGTGLSRTQFNNALLRVFENVQGWTGCRCDRCPGCWRRSLEDASAT